MFKIFHTETLWNGTDMKKFNEIRAALDQEGIKYKYKVKDRLGQWTGRGTLRGNIGSLGNPPEQAKEYEILVEKEDMENAKTVLAEIL